jgi:hypothetical protein
VLHKRADDQYTGKILSGMPVLSAQFALSHPDFVPAEVGLSVVELQEKQKVVDEKVWNAVNELFGDVIPTNLRKVFKFALASFLHHQAMLEEVYYATAHIDQL